MTRPSRLPSLADRNRPPLRHRVHRYTGIGAGTVLVYLLLTGLPLQFTNGLNLGSRYVGNLLILDWYGFRAPAEGWHSNEAVHIGGRLYWQRTPVAEIGSFQGALQLKGLVIAASGRQLLVFPADEPTLLETIGLPETLLAIGTHQNRVVLRTDSKLLDMDADLLNPEATDVEASDVEWTSLSPLDADQLSDFQVLARQRMLTMERLLQDLHSGRTFGTLGEWIVNLGSLALVVLSVTGLMIWWRSRLPLRGRRQ